MDLREPNDVGIATIDVSQSSKRQRMGWLERSLPLPSLPVYSGSHHVGTLDVEIPIDPPRAVSDLKLVDGRDALRLETLLFTIFYPTQATRGPRLSWVKYPRIATAAAYASWAGVSPWFLVPIALLLTCIARLPAFLNAPFLRAPQGKRRLIVFSHGLAGHRCAYSQMCGELASRGYVVAAIEHRDGSAPVSFVQASKGTGAARVDLYRPEDIRQDTRLPAIDMRKCQVEMRTQEIAELLKFVSVVVSGDDLPQFLGGGARTRKEDVDWHNWENGIELTRNVVLAGHSFGGATAVHCTRALPSNLLRAISHAILLDPWLEPLPASSCRSTVPFLALNSPGFTRWKANFAPLQHLVRHSGPYGALATLGGSSHTSFSDFPLMTPRLWRLVQTTKKPAVDPQKAIDLICRTTIAFIERDGATSPLKSSQGAIHAGEMLADIDDPGKVYVHVDRHAS